MQKVLVKRAVLILQGGGCGLFNAEPYGFCPLLSTGVNSETTEVSSSHYYKIYRFTVVLATNCYFHLFLLTFN